MSTENTNAEELKKSSMGFELTDGKILLIHNDDIKKLVDQFWIQMILDKRTHVYISDDPGLQRARELYKVFEAEKKDMDDTMKRNYLKMILKYLSDNNFELSTLDEKVKNNHE